MKAIIDRFEGDYVVVELPNIGMVDMPISLLPDSAAEGDVISICYEIVHLRQNRHKKGKASDIMLLSPQT